MQLRRLNHSKALWLLSWLLCLLDRSRWGKPTAMFWAALWRSPHAKKVRESHGQCGMKNSGPQPNSQCETEASWQQPPYEWPWRWSLQHQSSLRMTAVPSPPTTWLQPCERPWASEASSRSLPLDCKIINACCLKLLKFELTCHAVIDS